MTDLVDRVALAIREKIGTRHNGLPKGGWDGLMKLAAIAAIEAMREPTKEIIEAGGVALDDALDSDYDSDADGNRHEYSWIRSGAQTEVWRAMIDAALKHS